MSREVRRVPANWEHPRNESGIYRPLFGGSFAKRAAEWDLEAAQWAAGFRRSYDGGWVQNDKPCSFEEWDGPRPVEGEYMPDWPDAERTHLQMYETTTEGSPISPVMETAEQLARWLANNGASAFGPMTASYDDWLAMILQGSSVGSVMLAGGTMISGVAAAAGRNKP